MDYGVTVHVCGNESSFHTYGLLYEGTMVVCVDGHRVVVYDIGRMVLKIRNGYRGTL